MYKTYSGYITKLNQNEVFVFGSNWDEKNKIGGFHGAGSAGYASFGVTGNQWRQFKYYEKPKGWKGKWNTKGIGEGFQEGTEGKSYALPTVIRAGDKKSFSKDQIKESIHKLYVFANEHKELDFLIAYRNDGDRLLNGYTIEEMAEMFTVEKIPENIIFEDKFFELLKGII